MSKKGNPEDLERYFNDAEYRKKITRERNQKKIENASLGKKIWLFSITAVLLLAMVGSGYVYYLFQGLPSIQELENPRTAIASEVRSRDGVVLDRYFIENRTYVSIDNISPNAINALVATEDHRFFNHWGIDSQSLMRLPYYWVRQRFHGASTISQQLARNLYRKIGFDVSITRKLREMITAVQIENNYTKREIIEMYLNTVEFSNSAFGIESASRTHYSKPAKDLTVSEAATLIGQLRAVYAYNPRLFPERAQLRRNVVLGQMAVRGFISDEVFQNLREEEILLDYSPPSRSGRESRYFGEYIRQQVQGWVEENGYDLFADGLVIYTTIDSRLQRHADMAVREQLEGFQRIFEREWTSAGGSYMNRLWAEYPGFLRSFIRETDRYKNAFSKLNTNQESVVFQHLEADEAFVDSLKRARTKLQASFTAIDPTNGHILAWVGGADYGAQQFDHVHQAPGRPVQLSNHLFTQLLLITGICLITVFQNIRLVLLSNQEECGARKTPRSPLAPRWFHCERLLREALTT
jgi:penicillin-binding protein 1A